MSRVAKYLAAIGKEFKPEVAVTAEEPAPQSAEAEAAPMSRVAKYLASQNKAVAESAGLSASVAQIVADLGNAVETAEAEVEALAIEDEAVAVEEAAAVEEEIAGVAADEVIRLDDGLQCQAGTAKGTQCKNKANLGQIQTTLNDKTYQFSVCTQHNNDHFKPFAGLVEA